MVNGIRVPRAQNPIFDASNMIRTKTTSSSAEGDEASAHLELLRQEERLRKQRATSARYLARKRAQERGEPIEPEYQLRIAPKGMGSAIVRESVRRMRARKRAQEQGVPIKPEDQRRYVLRGTGDAENRERARSSNERKEAREKAAEEGQPVAGISLRRYGQTKSRGIRVLPVCAWHKEWKRKGFGGACDGMQPECGYYGRAHEIYIKPDQDEKK